MDQKHFIIYECLIGFIGMIIILVTCSLLCKKNTWCCFWLTQIGTSKIKKIIEDTDETVKNCPEDGPEIDASKIVSTDQTTIAENRNKPKLKIDSRCGATWNLERKATMSPSKNPIEFESDVIDHEKISTPLPYEKFKQLYKCDADVSPVKPPGWSFKYPLSNFATEKKGNTPVKVGSAGKKDKWGINLERVPMGIVAEQFSDADMDLEDSWNFPKVENVKLERDLAQDFKSELHLNHALGLDSSLGGDQV
jgi:hypothetical protein